MTLQLFARGATQGRVLHHHDLYFRHPSRHFRQTHEALRLRRCDSDVFITYKGPVVDKKTKMSREIEIAIGRSLEVVGRSTNGDLDFPTHLGFFVDHRTFIGDEDIRVATPQAKCLVRLLKIAQGCRK